MKHKKVYFLIVLFIFLFYLVLNYITLSAPEWNKEEANSYDHMCDDCILYVQKNGLHSFPFVFGQSLYMYSVDSGKKTPVHRELLPGQRIADNYTIYKNYVLYENRDFKGGPSGQVVVKDVSRGIEGKYDLCDNMFALKDEKLYSCEVDGIYETKVSDGTKKRIIAVKDDASWFYEIKIEKDWLITQDEYYGNALFLNLRTNEIYEIEGIKGDFYSAITFMGEENILTILGKKGDLLEINLKTDEKKVLSNIDKKTQVLPYSLNVVNNDIYCNNQEGDIIKVDKQTGEKDLLIDISKAVNCELDMKKLLQNSFLVHYSDKYIFVEYEYNESGYDYPLKDILVFQYDGELIMKESVIQ